MKVTLPYGAQPVSIDLKDVRLLDTLDVADAPELPDLPNAIARAIEQPIGLDANIYDTVQPGERVAILVSDAFRKTGAREFLPPLLAGLNKAGIPDGGMCLLFATGTHRAPTAEEQAYILGEDVYERFQGRLHVHDAHDRASHVEIGVTSRGTPVRINRIAREADRLIATGTVVLHYFGGFGGGRKSILPGIASVDTIAHNHAMNLDPHADRRNPAVRIGELDGNPVAEDMLEGARLTHIDYVINTVMNSHGQIAGMFAGELDAAHRAAAALARDLYVVPIQQRADLIIASSGTAQNFVQSHKALYNAYQAIKPDGRILFLGHCAEGLGSEQFVKWLRLGSTEAIIAGLRKHAEINGQTALSTIEKAPIAIFVTEMTRQDVSLMQSRKAASIEEALAVCLDELPENPTCYVMPSASYTVPLIKD